MRCNTWASILEVTKVEAEYFLSQGNLMLPAVGSVGWDSIADCTAQDHGEDHFKDLQAKETIKD